MSFISYLINGISLGSVYAIIALGYTMVYGIAKMLNFAHGDVIMIGAYMALITMMKAGMSPILAIVAAVIVCTVLGILIERIAYKPLRNASSSLAVLITAIGVSYLLQNTALLVFGANAQTFPSVIKWKGLSLAGGKLNISGETILAIVAAVIVCTVLGILIERIAYKPLRNASSSLAVLITAIGVSYLLQNTALLVFGANAQTFPSVIKWKGLSLAGGKLNISGETIVTIAACVVIMIVLMLFVQKSKPGQAMRAVSEDKGAAQLMGINVNGTIALTFAIGSALAAVAGVLLCSAYPSLTPYTGAMPGIKAFVAAVFGGIGSIPGAFIGGILLGVIEIFGKAYISSQMADAIVFAVLIIVLLVKPTGLLGKKIQEKV